jgi:predicted phosphodiesterase
VVQQFVKDQKPDAVVHIGDFADYYSLGKYRKSPGQARVYLDREEAICKAKLEEWRELAPKAEYHLIEGNHEDRVRRYLADHAQEVYGSRHDTIQVRLGIAERGWKYHSPYPRAGMWLGKHGGIWACHGKFVLQHSAYTARKHVERMGLSVIHGHTHRLGAYFRTHTLTNKAYVGYEVGCLCDPKTTPGPEGFADWQFGFASVWVSTKTKRFHVDLVAITDGGCVVAGKEYVG